jgi:hypothetical protein
LSPEIVAVPVPAIEVIILLLTFNTLYAVYPGIIKSPLLFKHKPVGLTWAEVAAPFNPVHATPLQVVPVPAYFVIIPVLMSTFRT